MTLNITVNLGHQDLTMSKYTTYLEAKENRIDILSDDFDSPTGEWNNFIARNLSQLGQIQNQKHTDIRSFKPKKEIRNYIVFLGSKTVGSLDYISMNQVGGFYTLAEDEGWTSGTVGQQGDRNNWYGISLSCSANSTASTQSILSERPINLFSYNAVDYDEDYISLSLPKYNNAINRSNSKIEFTSTDFSNSANYDSIAFNATNVVFKQSGENAELRIPLKYIRESIRQNLIGIKITIANNSNSTINFRCLSIRCVSKNWKYAPIDINTISNTVEYTPSPNGEEAPDFETTYYWPINENNNQLPTEWPVLYKSFTNTNLDNKKPTPINSDVQIIFNSGSIKKSSSKESINDISVYFRDDLRESQQSDLDGQTQERLDLINNFADLHINYNYKKQKDYSKIPGKIVYKTSLVSEMPSGTDPGQNGGVFVKDVSIADNSGFVLVENEIISYTSIIGNELKISQRGANDTLAKAHLQNAPVYLVGKLGFPVNLNQDASITDTKIFVNDTQNFPPTGVIVIDDEYIKYSAKTLDGFVVAENGRGYWSSQPQYHSASTKVHFYTHINRKGSKFYTTRVGNAQSSLNGIKQSALSYSKDLESQSSYIRISIQWYTTNQGGYYAQIVVSDEINIEKHVFNLPVNLIEPSKDYVFIPSINNDILRMQLFRLYHEDVSDPNHMTPIYDTGEIRSSLVKRRKGQFGWSAQFFDGDCYIQSIRSRGATYAELKSANKTSRTPVKGVQAFVDGTIYGEMVSTIYDSPFNSLTSTVKIDDKKNGSVNCRQVVSTGGLWQGLSTNTFVIDDYNDIEISFNAYITSSSQNLKALLYNEKENILIQIKVPSFNPNQWEFIKLNIDGSNHLSGSYSFIIAEEQSQFGSTWWIDNLSVKKLEMQWFGRAYTNGINQIGSDTWMPMRTMVNKTNSGTMFSAIGKDLEIKGEARTQFVNINEIKFVPEYAKLGNLVKGR